MAVVDYARAEAGLKDAQSREFAEAAQHFVVDYMDDQRNVVDKGGTMRLGAWPCALKEGTLARRIYGAAEISERHRHRLEVSPTYVARLEAAGMVFSGTSPDGRLVEMIELPNHPYFVGCQFHPEFKSRPLAPHPLFVSFVRAAIEHQLARGNERLSEDNPLGGVAALA
jgi:CTP synthase